MKNNNLRVWYNGLDHVIAKSEDDAVKVSLLFYGDDYLEYAADFPFSMCEDDEIIGIKIDEGHGKLVSLTCREWVERGIEGILC